MTRTTTWTFALFLAFTTSAGAAVTNAQKCEADKEKAAGNYADCVFSKERKHTKKPDPLKLIDDLAKCDDKLSIAYTKAEAKYGAECPTSGDFALVRDSLQAQASRAAEFLAGGQGTPADVCGDGIISGTEECDTGEFGGETCGTQGFDGGSLGCSFCSLDDSGCYTGRWTDHGNGTATDNTTGLMWELKTDDGSIHDKDDFNEALHRFVCTSS